MQPNLNIKEKIQQNPAIVIILFLEILLVIIFTIINIIKSTKNVTVSILVAPSNATVTINNQSYPNGTYNFYPGDYEAIITKDGFDSKKITFTAESNKIVRLYDFLTQNKNFDYYRSNYEDYQILQQVSKDDKEVKNFLDDYDKELSLKSFLPLSYLEDYSTSNNYINLIFSYETERCKEKPYCILITDTIEGNYNFAINYLGKYGYTPEKYEIIYEALCKRSEMEKCYRI